MVLTAPPDLGPALGPDRDAGQVPHDAGPVPHDAGPVPPDTGQGWPSLAADTEALLHAVTAVQRRDPLAMAEAAALQEAAAVLLAAQRLQVLSLARLADLQERQLFALGGHRSMTSWLQYEGLQVDRIHLALARKLRRLPAVSGALRDETITIAGAVRVGQAIDRLRPHLDRTDATIDGQPSEQVLPAVVVDGVLSVLAEGRGGLDDDDPGLAELCQQLSQIADDNRSESERLEAAFVVLAAQLDAGLLRSGLDALVGALLPNELEQANTDAVRRRTLTLTRKEDGSGWLLRGELTLEAGELLYTALHAQLLTDPANPADTAAAADVIAAHPEQDPQDLRASRFSDPTGPRTRAQRMHDGLGLLCQRLLDSAALGTRNKAAPHLNVLVGLDALHGAPGALPARGASGAQLPRSVLSRWWCQSQLTRVVLDARRRVLEVSHTQRLHRAHERKALAIRWGDTCAVQGCSPAPVPGRRLTAHHVTPYADSGTTTLADSVLLCEPSHHQLHEGQLLQLKDGRWIGPHGWVPPPTRAPRVADLVPEPV